MGSRSTSDVPMLGICTAPGCSTIVFGHGTCVDHDRGGSTGEAARVDVDADAEATGVDAELVALAPERE